jgi:PH (Pleckstrin Homology) domain-containing protein
VGLAALCGVSGAANVILSLVAASRGDAARSIGGLVWAAMVFAACIFAVAQASDVVVPNYRVVVRRRRDTYLRDVQTVTLRQTNAGRRRDYGDVIVRGGGRRLTLRFITNAAELQYAVLSGTHGRATPASSVEWGRIAALVAIYGVLFINLFAFR